MIVERGDEAEKTVVSAEQEVMGGRSKRNETKGPVTGDGLPTDRDDAQPTTNDMREKTRTKFLYNAELANGGGRDRGG